MNRYSEGNNDAGRHGYSCSALINNTFYRS
jgi:hypothetical protein